MVIPFALAILAFVIAKHLDRWSTLLDVACSLVVGGLLTARALEFYFGRPANGQ
jgi:hypothetical protein